MTDEPAQIGCAPRTHGHVTSRRSECNRRVVGRRFPTEAPTPGSERIYSDAFREDRYDPCDALSRCVAIGDETGLLSVPPVSLRMCWCERAPNRMLGIGSCVETWHPGFSRLPVPAARCGPTMTRRSDRVRCDAKSWSDAVRGPSNGSPSLFALSGFWRVAARRRSSSSADSQVPA